MAQSSSHLLHTCSKTQSAVEEIDCTSCQLAQLCHTKGDSKAIDTSRGKGADSVADDDYSISTELTSKGNDYSILYLVIAAVGILALVVAFYKFFLL